MEGFQLEKNKLVIILIIFFLIIIAIGAIFFTNRLRSQKSTDKFKILDKKSTQKLQMLNDYSLDGDHPNPGSNDKPY